MIAPAVACQWLAWTLRIPSLLVLLVAGFSPGQWQQPDAILGRDMVFREDAPTPEDCVVVALTADREVEKRSLRNAERKAAKEEGAARRSADADAAPFPEEGASPHARASTPAGVQ